MFVSERAIRCLLNKNTLPVVLDWLNIIFRRHVLALIKNITRVQPRYVLKNALLVSFLHKKLFLSSGNLIVHLLARLYA
jgi:hypothetical protein